MLDGTYLSRNFATLGPMIRQPPCDYLFISFQRLSLLKIGPAKVPIKRLFAGNSFPIDTRPGSRLKAFLSSQTFRKGKYRFGYEERRLMFEGKVQRMEM